MESPSSTQLRAIDSTYAGHKTVVFTGCFLVLLVSFVSLRFYTKWLIKWPWGADDILILASLGCHIVFAGITLDGVQNGGLGYHQAYLEATAPWKVPRWGKDLYASTQAYMFCAVLPKYAILVLYRRLFITKKVRICIYVLMVTLALYAVILITVAAAACTPFAANWNPTIPGSKCINKENMYRWGPFPNIVSDVCMLILPMPIVWNLHTGTRLKIGLTLTFLVGSLGMIVSIIRVPIFFRTDSFTDGTYSGAELLIWSQLEPGCYLISACLMTLRPLLEKFTTSKFVQSLKGTTNRGSRVSRVMNSRRRENTESSINLHSLRPSVVHQVSIQGQGFRHLSDHQNDSQSQEIFVRTELEQKSEILPIHLHADVK